MRVRLGDTVIEDPVLFDRMYSALERGEPVLVDLPVGTFRVVGYEPWESDCLFYYADVEGIDLPNDPDELDSVFWDILPGAIEWAMRQDGYDGYLYVPPEVCGVAYGATLWLKRVG